MRRFLVLKETDSRSFVNLYWVLRRVSPGSNPGGAACHFSNLACKE